MSRVEAALRQAARVGGPEAIDPVPEPTLAPAVPLESYSAERRRAGQTSETLRAHAPRVHACAVAPATRRDPKLVSTPRFDPIPFQQYARLAAVLHEVAADRQMKVVIVSSAAPREGKTLTVANLALTLGNSYQQRVLAIDADLRHPSLHELFGLPNTTGLADVLENADGALALVAVSEHVAILPAGRAAANPMAGLTSGAMKQLLERVATSFDWIIVDTPPIGLLPDAQVIARDGDGVLLVIGAGVSPYTLVERAISTIGPDRVLGVVLNRADAHLMPGTRYYADYYGSSTVTEPSD